MNNKETRSPKTLKYSGSKTIRPRKLNSSHHVDLVRSTLCELFSLRCLIVLDLEHFKVLWGVVFGLLTLYLHFMVWFIFLCLKYTDPFKIPSMNVTWEFYQNSRQSKKFKKTVKSLINFWKQSMFKIFFWFSPNTLNLPEWKDTFQVIQIHPTQCRNFLENKGTVLTIKKFLDIPHNLETIKTLWESSRQYGKYT